MSFYCTVDEGTIQNNDFVVYLTSTSSSSVSAVLFQFGLSWLGWLAGMVFLVWRRYAAGISYLIQVTQFRFSWLARDEAHTFSLWFMIESFGFDLL